MKISAAIKKETMHIALGTLILSIIMIMVLVFFLLKKFDLTVLWGTLLGAGFAVLNFFLLGLTIQKATTYNEGKAKSYIQFSYSVRMLLHFAVLFMGVQLSCFNWVAVALPLLFPRITIALMHLFKLTGKGEE